MKITIIQIGKTAGKPLKELENEYLKRLSKYIKPEITVIKDSVEAKSESEKEILKEKEAASIIAKIPKNHFIVALDETGSHFSSLKFADFIQSKKDHSQNICFIIGGVYGLSDHIRKRADLILSFSKMTFTHEMIRTLLLEQIYRAFTIINGKKYHY